MSMPKEPRMAMINMMYLVLTAMLAMNITKEVLNAFGIINDSIERSNAAITLKNESIYKGLEDQMSDSKIGHKVKPWNDLALNVKKETDDLIVYLNSLKDSVITISGGMMLNDEGDSVIANIENIDASPNFFINKKHGDALKERLISYKTNILNIIPQDAREQFASNFAVEIPEVKKTDENPSGDWAFATFNNVPVVASIALLSKFQNDAKNTEAIVLEYLKSQIGVDDYKFDKLEPVAVPNTSYALAGQEIEAKILLAAYNSQVNPSISSSAGAVKVENGVGTLKFKANGVGLQTVRGTIVTEKNGTQEKYDYNFSYMVGTAGASMGLDKMNVMYIGVPNPVSLSASGYNIEDVDLVLPADVTRTASGKGKYVLNVTKPGTFTYNIVAKDRTGGRANVGSGEIRVKRIPDPVAAIMKKTGGAVASNQLMVQQGISTEIPGFDFEAKFEVLSYDFMAARKASPDVEQVLNNRGAYFSNKVKDILKLVKAGDIVIFNNIKVKGPDGSTRTVNSITFNII